MMKFVNLTPHEVNLNCGTNYPASGNIARVASKFIKKEGNTFIENTFYKQSFGEIENLPEQDSSESILYIVSGMVFAATNRSDVIAPATGHPDTRRNSKGHIISVPGFVVK